MYMITEAERDIRIPPARLSENIDDVIESLTWESFEGKVDETDKDTYTVLVMKPKAEGQGRIVYGDECVIQKVSFKQLVYKPKDGEVVEGDVQRIESFGAFVRIGPTDGLVHISQVMDDRVDPDLENQRLVGKESGRTLTVGDRVRARIISLGSSESNVKDRRLVLTMRQPGLGKLEWIDEDCKKKEKGGA